MSISLQEQYNNIKAGKGAKDVFLKHAKSLFPHLIPNHLGFDLSVQILKQKSILNESIIESESTDGFGNRSKEPWENKFEKFLTEEKQKQDEKIKADLKKTDKSVVDSNESHYDNDDPKNADNVIFDQFMRGIYTELGEDPDQELDAVKTKVLKNLAKDPIWYTKNSAFGIKGIGYTDDSVSLKLSKSDKTEEVSKLEKSNVKDNLSKKEAASKGKPKEVKSEMTITPKKTKGVKVMDMPGKEKIIKLKENQSLSDLLETELDEAKNKVSEDVKEYLAELYDGFASEDYEDGEKVTEVIERSEFGSDAYENADMFYKAYDEIKKLGKVKITDYNPEMEFTIKGEDIVMTYVVDYDEDLDENLSEGKSEIDPNYTYFAIRKSNNKIVNGWETVSDIESLKYYAKIDLKDIFPDNKLSDFKLLSKGALTRQGIDPFDSDNWEKTNENPINESSFESKLKEMVEGALEDADAKLAKDAANKEAEAAAIEKQRADNKLKIANQSKNI